MNLLILLTAALLLITKFLDCYSTKVRIGGNIENENNPLAQRIMRSLQFNETIWLFFLIAAVIIFLSTFMLFRMNAGLLYQSAFVIIGLFISTIQFAVAHNNYYRRSNTITRFIMKIYRRLIW